MVKRRVKKYYWLAITLFVIANLVLGSYVFAKQLEIKAEDVERIKTALGMAQTIATVSDIIINNKDLTTVLNTVLKGGTAGVDVTYGLVVLGALNEMDLVDLVVSGRYRDEAREYLNSVLNQTTNLTSYWKSASQNIFSLIKRSAVTPTTGLAMESVAILEKTMSVIISAKVWLTVETYNGMWRYFQDRMGGESHQRAWSYAMVEMGRADQIEIKNNELFVAGKKSTQQKDSQLEQQFLALYENWAPYVTPFGISDEYKKQIKEELSGTLITAIEENTALARNNEPKISLIERLAQQLDKLREAAATLMSRINPFKAGIALNLPETPKELAEAKPLSIEPISIEKLIEVKPQSIEADIETVVDTELAEAKPLLITTSTVPELTASTTEPVPTSAPESTPAPTLTMALAPKPVFCERESGNPTRFRVLINEVAWMGTKNSADDEWIELKNVWGIPVKLSGWQLLDKDKQIKIIFDEDDVIPAGGYYLLERTDDDSIPDAKADLIYTGTLGNTNEALYLFDAECRIEDEILANPNWLVGDNSSKKPMVRLDVLDWYTGVSTPAGENSPPPVIHASASTPTPKLESSNISPIISITETYIGSGNNEKDDFVELYNPDTAAVDLTDWYLQRKTAGSQGFSSYVTHELLAGKTIRAKDYFLIANASSTFATSADVITEYPLTENNILVLKNGQQEIIDEISTDNPEINKSYGRRWSSATLDYTENFEIQTPTPRAQNQNTTTTDSIDDETSLSVIINEIAWADTKANAFDEWIEFYNNSTSSVDMNGWRLSSSDVDGPDITFSSLTATTTVSARGFYLIERTDDGAVSDVSADWTGAFGNSLSNTNCEVLSLYDNSGNLIDRTACSGADWPGGETSPHYIAMERISNASGTDPQNWASNNLMTKNGSDANGNLINGTPKAKNSVAKNYTVLSGGITFSENFTLRRLGSPYISDGPIHVLSNVTLSIEPGVIIKLKHGSSRTPYAELKVEGSLSAIGSESQKIVFTSYKDDEYGGDTNNDGAATAPAAGDWDWVYFKDSISNLQNVIVRYGGKLHSSCCGEFSPYTYGAIYVEGGWLTMSSSTIEKSETLGLWIKNSSTTQINGTEFKNINTAWSKPAAVYIENGSSTISNSVFRDNNIGILVENFASPAIKNNTFSGNQIPIQISTLSPIISGNTISNNNYNGIYLTSLAFPEGQVSMAWKNENIPYIIGALNLASGLMLQVEPGVIIKFLSNGRLNIEGGFEANGTTSDKIVFTSIQDDEYGGDTNNDGASTQAAAGRWQYVYFTPSSANPILENIIVRYGGWYNVSQGGQNAKSGAVKIESTSSIIRNSLFENNLFAGLQIVNATTTIENTAFNKNEHGIYVEAGRCPNLAGVIFGTGENANSVDVYCQP